MSVPLATTTISVFGHRPPLDVDPEATGWDGSTPEAPVVASDVRASITQPEARRGTPTDQTDVYTLSCDPFPAGLLRNDVVLDVTTGVSYIVHSVAPSTTQTFGLDHFKAKLRIDRGIRIDKGVHNGNPQ